MASRAPPPPGPGPGPVLTPQQLGVLLLMQMIVQTSQLNDLAEFEDTLTRFDYVILDSPESVYCAECHPHAGVPSSPYSGTTSYLAAQLPPTTYSMSSRTNSR